MAEKKRNLKKKGPDRRQAPPIRAIERLQLPPILTYRLSNGMPVYEIRLGTQEVVKLEVIFHAGRPYEVKKLVARATAAQVKEGSRQHHSVEIDEHFDFYGSSLSVPSNLDTANLVLYSLTKHFGQVLPMVAEILADPVFPEEELLQFRQRNQRRLLVDLSKPDVVAYRQITECIFGESHPYGYNSRPADYDQLTRADLSDHHRRLFNAGNGFILISGKTDDALLSLLDQHLGQAIPPGPAAVASPVVTTRPPGQIHLPFPDRVQAAIRIGRRLFNRQHADYPGLYVLNTILGGYFGSRLMANIREEKGYTYNIYSLLDNMRFDGGLYIGTEVGNEFVEDTLRQIYREMEELQETLVEEEELEMVRNYLLGNFLTMLDGPFNVSEVVKTLLTDGVPPAHFDELVATVQTIDAPALRSLAQQYLNRQDMWEVVVG